MWHGELLVRRGCGAVTFTARRDAPTRLGKELTCVSWIEYNMGPAAGYG